MTRDQWLSRLATLLLVGSAVTMTGIVAARELRRRTPPPAAPPVSEADWQRLASTGHRTGPPVAALTIVVFSDFQCPACQTLTAVLDSVHSRNPNQIAEVFRHHPLASHLYALPAARASECAARQGRFRPFHDALFAEQPRLGLVPWNHFARLAAVPDSTAFNQCVAAGQQGDALARDIADGERLQIRGTPTLFVNGIRVDGVPSVAELEAHLRNARTRAPRRAADGPISPF